MKIIKITITALCVMLAATALFAGPRLRTYPKILIAPTDNTVITWDDAKTALPITTTCRVLYGNAPGNYTGFINQSANGNLTFTPQAAGLSGGVYYMRVSDTVYNQTSAEFKLFVESQSAPVYTAPANGASVNTLNPNLSWQAVSGVPYYTVVMFDTVPEIDISSGGLSITASVIWAGTTPATSLEYPQPDPSGYYSKLDPPPLMQGLTYSWAVINNYSGTPSMVSEVFAGTRSFFVTPPSAASAPVINSPVNGVTLTSSPVTLSWQAAAGANNYKVYINKSESASGSVTGAASLPVYTAYTNSTSLQVPANIGLNTSEYKWYVIALDNAGRGNKSTEEYFYYHTTTTAVNVHVTENDPVNGTVDVPQAIIYMDTVAGGTVNLYPFTCGDNGQFGYDLPYGDYKFTVMKEGFNTGVFYRTVSNTAVAANFTLVRSAYTLRGKVLESGPSSAVAGALVTAELNGVTATANTIFDGSYALYLSTYGNWNITVTKAGFAPKTVSVNVNDQAVSLTYDAVASNIMLSRNVNVLSGSVTNSMAMGINAALVTASETSNTSNSYTDYTDALGAYSMNLPDGDFTVTVSKAGFVAPPSTSVSLSAQNAVRDFVMQEAANMVSGAITRDGAPFGGVTVRAVPLAGAPVETVTDAFGNYVLSLGTGTFAVDAYYTGYTSDGIKNMSFATGGNTSNNVDFAMAENGSFVNGTVLQSGGAPLSGVLVSNGLASDYTDTLGAYTLSMQSGTYTVTAVKAGYSSPSGSMVTLLTGQTINGIDFVLSPNAAVINGACHDISGTAVAAADVMAVTAGNTLTVKSDASGNFTFNVPYGYWGIKALKPDFTASQTITMALMPGQVSSGHDLVLGYDIGYVSGTVKDMTSLPLPGADITILDAAGSTKTITADAYGKYLIAIKTGGYFIRAAKTGYITDAGRTGSVTVSDTALAPKIENFALAAASKTILGKITALGQNVPGAGIIVVAPGATISAFADAAGDYSVSIPGITSAVSLTVNKTGYVPYVNAVAIPGQVLTQNVTLSPWYGTLGMTINTSDAGAVNAVVYANGITKAASGASGMAFNMPLMHGTYDVYVEQAGYDSVTRLAVPVTQGSLNDIGTVTLQAPPAVTRTISGTVTDGISPVSGASVEIRNSTGSVLYATVITTGSGVFSVSGLAAQSYTLIVFKTGYTPPPVSAPDVTAGDITGLVSVLTPNTASVWVGAKASSNSSAISGAAVSLVGTGSNTGNSGFGTTGAAGSVTITGLAAGAYDITVSRPGFTDEFLSVTAIGGSVIYNTVSMDPDPLTLGFAGGYIKNSSGSGVSGVAVKIYEQANPGIVYSLVTSQSDGSYGNTIPAGSYTIVPSKDSYVISPAAAYVNVPAASGVLANFTADTINGGGVVITPPVNLIYNSGLGGPYVFTAAYADADGKISPAVFAWSVAPAEAGSIDQSGVFTPASSYIGQIKVTAAALGKTTVLTAQVYQKLTVGNPAMTLRGEENMTLSIPSNAYSAANTIDSLTVMTSDPGRARMTSGDFKVLGKIYSLTGGITFSSALTLTLPVDRSFKTKGVSMGLWDSAKLKWTQISSNVSGVPDVSASVTHFSDYAVLSLMSPLSLDTVTLTPNPFSPMRGGLNIDYAVSSTEAPQVFVTIKVFSVTGELIRVIADNEPRNTGPVINDRWDGKDKNGKLAANGRYFIQLEITDPSGKKQHIFSAALVK